MSPDVELKEEGLRAVDPVEQLPISTEPIRERSFDMFPLFMEQLALVLGAGTKTEEEVRLALGLEKSQLKTWLAAAVAAGGVEKQKKPVAYSLPKQKSLY